MKLYHRLILFVLAATFIPLGVGLLILHQNEQSLRQRLISSREEAAVRLAEAVTRDLREIMERVQDALGYVSPEQVTREELQGLLAILYKQSEDIIQVALLDHLGAEVVEGIFLDDPKRYPEYAGRLAVSKEDHPRFVKNLPLRQALEIPLDSVVLGAPYLLPQTQRSGFAFLVPVDLPGSKRRWLAAIEVSLGRVARAVSDNGGANAWDAWLVDESGRLLASSQPQQIGALLSGAPALNSAAAKLSAGEKQGAFFENDALWAFAKAPLLGWAVILSQSQDEAMVEVRRIRQVTLLWTIISIAALLLLGGLFTSRITRNLRLFVAGAQQYSRGNLEARINIGSGDELGLLAKTFNQMGQDLKLSRAEIERWNQELTQRVEARTRELEVAHRRLLETSKLAAIGQLGAGVAHEINNPLVGILGNVQLLQMKQGSVEQVSELLKKIELSAKRCKDVVQNLQRFSEPEEDPEHHECDLAAALKDAFSLTEQRIRSQNILVNWKLDALPTVLGNHRELVHVFFNLFINAKTAMPQGGSLTIGASPLADHSAIEIRVSDTGKGIAPDHLDRIFEPFFTTKDEWTNTGLGLSMVYRIIADHGGQITVSSEVGKGSVFRVTLPVIEEPA